MGGERRVGGVVIIPFPDEEGKQDGAQEGWRETVINGVKAL